MTKRAAPFQLRSGRQVFQYNDVKYLYIPAKGATPEPSPNCFENALNLVRGDECLVYVEGCIKFKQGDHQGKRKHHAWAFDPHSINQISYEVSQHAAFNDLEFRDMIPEGLVEYYGCEFTRDEMKMPHLLSDSDAYFIWIRITDLG